jgi:carboxylate-amine ligase
VYVQPETGEHLPLREHILRTLDRVEPHARTVGAAAAIDMLRQSADRGANDARWLRETHARERLLAETVRQAAERFRGRRA